MKSSKIYVFNIETKLIVKKLSYISPSLTIISMDNEISLTLESTPPTGPNELIVKAPDYFENDPFKNNG